MIFHLARQIERDGWLLYLFESKDGQLYTNKRQIERTAEHDDTCSQFALALEQMPEELRKRYPELK